MDIHAIYRSVDFGEDKRRRVDIDHHDVCVWCTGGHNDAARTSPATNIRNANWSISLTKLTTDRVRETKSIGTEENSIGCRCWISRVNKPSVPSVETRISDRHCSLSPEMTFAARIWSSMPGEIRSV